ncbi:MAG TPA: glycoside hydrolase family 15 protein, partial [Thermoanaerobaculia bacterium]|nr:glycoside hydrolase family 15 protein [Thermoanaerobaculia bacterium]
RWKIAPRDAVRDVQRRYRDDTLILETTFETGSGRVRIVDFMPLRTDAIDVMRIVEGVEGRVPMRMDFAIRFDYGSIVPWVRATERGIRAIAGPDTVYLRADVPMHGENFTTVSEFEVAAGDRVTFDLTWTDSHHPQPPREDPCEALIHLEQFWRGWSSRCTYDGKWRDAVMRSLITLKALTYAPTGGIVAAATTSLPEQIGGVRNWDYRLCWLRDATFAIYALLGGGYTEEAIAWREWLVRAAAGLPEELQIMYSIRGERHLTELEIDWLPGYEGSKPVRVGNAAFTQYQLDVYGEVMDMLHLTRKLDLPPSEDAWRVQRALMRFLESGWKEPDEGIWEVRGPRRHFTHSKVMAWVAFDRAVSAVEKFGLDGPVEQWRAIRDEIRAEIVEKGFRTDLDAFTQFYGSPNADASLLMLPALGFIDAGDPRMTGTIAHIRAQLEHNGLLHRYPTSPSIDGLPPGEGTFLLCTFWLADTLALAGRYDEAEEIFERLLALRNDVGLLGEQYDPVARRQLGNFPQAFSHVGLINTAQNLRRQDGPSRHRQQ